VQLEQSLVHSSCQCENCSVTLWILSLTLPPAPFDDVNSHSSWSHLCKWLCSGRKIHRGGVTWTADCTSSLELTCCTVSSPVIQQLTDTFAWLIGWVNNCTVRYCSPEGHVNEGIKLNSSYLRISPPIIKCFEIKFLKTHFQNCEDYVEKAGLKGEGSRMICFERLLSIWFPS